MCRDFIFVCIRMDRFFYCYYWQSIEDETVDRIHFFRFAVVVMRKKPRNNFPQLYLICRGINLNHDFVLSSHFTSFLFTQPSIPKQFNYITVQNKQSHIRSQSSRFHFSMALNQISTKKKLIIYITFPENSHNTGEFISHMFWWTSSLWTTCQRSNIHYSVW